MFRTDMQYSVEVLLPIDLSTEEAEARLLAIKEHFADNFKPIFGTCNTMIDDQNPRDQIPGNYIDFIVTGITKFRGADKPACVDVQFLGDPDDVPDIAHSKIKFCFSKFSSGSLSQVRYAICVPSEEVTSKPIW